MSKSIFEKLRERVLLTDGALGTEIYNRGFFVNRCYDELNLSSSGVIREIHAKFAKAGANVLRTNTFGANRYVIENAGIGEKLEEINRRGVELAREFAGDSNFVAGAIGPVPEQSKFDPKELYGEQAKYLHEAGADFIFLESFVYLDDLILAYNAVKQACPDAEIVPGISFDSITGGQAANTVEEVIGKFKKMGSPILVFCDGDPVETSDRLPNLVQIAGDDLKLGVLPGSGKPTLVEGRMLSLASPEYMAEHARRYVQKGAGLIGGGYGITPDMIKEMCSFLRSVQPMGTVTIELEEGEKPDESMEPVPIEERTPFGKLLKNGTFGVSVELDPPKGIDATKSVEGAKFLYDNGINAVNIADGPRATGRMSPTALALLVKKSVPIETIVHVCCRDRNLLALQMDLISANALGLQNMMLITGDPPKMGIYPDSTAVFDMDAIGLVASANLLNHGLDFAKRPLQGQTQFLLGVGCNPGAPDLDLEVERYKEKVDAGAEYVFSQPVYDHELLETFLKRIQHVKPIPFYVGILPLASSKNAEFLHNNVPGMQVPDEIRKRMAMAPTKDAQRQEGIEIAADSLQHAASFKQVKGAYIFPPFGKYERILDVLEKSGVR